MSDWTWADWTVLTAFTTALLYVIPKATRIGRRNRRAAEQARQWLDSHDRGEQT